MDPSQVNVPPMKDLNIDNITENTVLINSQGPDQRLTYVLERLVTHLHDFARETRLSTKEWMAALNFLVSVGQISTDVRHVSFQLYMLSEQWHFLTIIYPIKELTQAGIYSPLGCPRSIIACGRHRSP